MGRPAKGIVTDEGRECTRCGKYKVWSQYNKGNGARNYSGHCKGCEIGYTEKAWKRMKAKIEKQPGAVYRVFTDIGEYIGQTNHIGRRITEHNTPTAMLRRRFKGITIESYEVLEYIEDPVQRKLREAYYISTLKPELNTLLVKERF